jgi:parallel beta-helix repeat protein
MDRWKRFVDWCQQPSKVKIRTFNPRNFVLIVLSILVISLISSGAWLYQVLSIAEIPATNRENYEDFFPTLIITEDTTLTEDHFGCIFIEADDVTLDGNGRTITGPGVWVWNSTERMWWPISCGITVTGRTGVTVKNCHITNFAWGLILGNSDGCTLLNNTIYDNVYAGISVVFSVNNTILENTVHSTRDVEEPYDYSGFSVEM